MYRWSFQFGDSRSGYEQIKIQSIKPFQEGGMPEHPVPTEGYRLRKQNTSIMTSSSLSLPIR